MNEVIGELYTHTLQGKWGEVVNLYKTKPEMWSSEITSSGDTALHMVINEDNEGVVAELVQIIVTADHCHDPKKVEALMKANEVGDTLLHRAAARGSVEMCYCIVEAAKRFMIEEDLLKITNKWGENPIFISALDNRKHVFIYLLRAASKLELEHELLTAFNGDTVLHRAIEREHYGISVDPLKFDDSLPSRTIEIGSTELEIGSREIECPDNYWLCRQILSIWRLGRGADRDPENHYHSHIKANVPQNYATCFQFLFMALQNLRGVLGFRKTFDQIIKARRTHTWSVQILDELLKNPKKAYMTKGGSDSGPLNFGALQDSPHTKFLEDIRALYEKDKKGDENKDEEGPRRTDTALLVAAQKGVVEVVNKILEQLPVSIHDTSSKKKNIVLVATENRQPPILDALSDHLNVVLKKPELWRDLVRAVDADGNTILHLAAKYDGEASHPWQIQGAAMQMQWEIKWYEYVKSFLPHHLTVLTNRNGETPGEIFLRHHKNLVDKSDEWLSRTSESCSVVAALVAGVSFATSSTVPGGNDDRSGKPTLEGHPGFDIFAVAALIALCFSVTALIMFLSILTSRKQATDFMRKLPVKLFLALSSLFASIISMFVSFCAAHSFVLEDKFKKSVIPLYVMVSLPVFFTIVEFPLYMDLFKGIFMRVPGPNDHIRI